MFLLTVKFKGPNNHGERDYSVPKRQGERSADGTEATGRKFRRGPIVSVCSASGSFPSPKRSVFHKSQVLVYAQDNERNDYLAVNAKLHIVSLKIFQFGALKRQSKVVQSY